jgi:hypothetical protein
LSVMSAEVSRATGVQFLGFVQLGAAHPRMVSME